MTKEEKQLLLKDLCARLPYGTYAHHKNFPNTKFKVIAVFDDGRIGVTENEIPLTPTSINECKPYLRPMSSMTEEEREELEGIFREYDNPCTVDEDGCLSFYGGNDFLSPEDLEIYIDFCNQHHFDYRGLIDKGLALEAPEDMYD